MNPDWPYKWFGWWRENGWEYIRCPSVLSFVDPLWEDEHRSVAIEYLSRGRAFNAFFFVYECMFCGGLCSRIHDDEKTYSYLTDGVWTWPSTLIHEVKCHGVRIPMPFQKWIERDEGYKGMFATIDPDLPWLIPREDTQHMNLPLPETIDWLQRFNSWGLRTHRFLDEQGRDRLVVFYKASAWQMAETADTEDAESLCRAYSYLSSMLESFSREERRRFAALEKKCWKYV
jgi:hypothetical protein